MDWPQLMGALIGLVGVPLGIVLGEVLRRRQRAEQFAAAIFSKRLEAYDKLMDILNESRSVASHVINSSTLSSDERHDLISSVVATIADHADRNILYIDEELGAHCVALFMGSEEVHDQPGAEQKESIKRLDREWVETRRMILEDSGVATVNRLFRDINRPRIESPFIVRIRELKRDLNLTTY
ncbi:hypothetical protein [Sphingopyxis sp. JAI108]|uniref:hypothetical protein n=1 Tax=Sphingopyxis sp. JAI108 TaxID=2723060 RepID=UPI0015C7B1FC|nr:hypothetical protein [Sphingopyxis sp. JAI108]NYF33678.1 hypothetical protein [Sphingopyxis sp. JAI108]